MQLESTKEIWDKLVNNYEGDEKVKLAKLQAHIMQFEILRMSEDENIAGFFLRVDETVNTMKGLGEKIEEAIVVQKVLRSLPSRLDAKVSAIEEMHELDKLTMDRLHGILTAYEMRTRKEQPDLKDAVFKASVKSSTSQDHNSSEHFSDEEEANFVRKLKRGSGKYKGMLPFKCFHCGKVGHFASKCPFKENNTNEKERKGKDKPREFKKKKSFKRNNFYSKEDRSNSSDTEEEEYEPDTIQDEKLLMALEQHKYDQEKKDTKECEVVVDMEGELISALEEISRLKKKNRLRKEQLQIYKEKYNEISEEIVILKIQLEEDKRREEILMNQIKEKENICDKLEA
jgi:hypothetical protein